MEIVAGIFFLMAAVIYGIIRAIENKVIKDIENLKIENWPHGSANFVDMRPRFGKKRK